MSQLNEHHEPQPHGAKAVSSAASPEALHGGNGDGAAADD
jgi:hypothetical protein